MAKSVDLDQVLDDIDTEDEDFGQGLDDGTPESSSEEGQATASSDDDSDDGGAGLDISPPDDADEDVPEDITFRGLAGEYGFNLPEDGDEAEIAQAFLQQTVQLRDYALRAKQQNEQFQQQLQHLQYQLSQQGQQPQQQAQPQTTEQKKQELSGLLKHWENKPEFHNDWLSYVAYDDNGNLVSKPGADPTLPQKIEAYRRWENQAQQAIYGNPQQFVFEAIQQHPAFQEAIQQQIHQAVYGLQDSLKAQRIAEQRSQYLYRVNSNGEKELTPAGQVYVNAVQLATQRGLTDTDSLDEIGWTSALPYVQAMLAQQEQQHQQQQQQEPETTSEKKRKRQLNWQKQQAKKNSNRGGSARSRQKTKGFSNEVEDLEKAMRERFQEEGIDLSSSAL